MAEGVASAERIERALAGTDVRLVYDIPAIGRFHPVTGRLLADVRAGRYGRPLGHSHSFSFTFSHDFPSAEVWPERLDPPARSGGGELTNLGCYAVDYMVGLWGRPRSIQAKTRRAWDAYREAGLEQLRPGGGRLRRLLRGARERQAAARRAADDGRGGGARPAPLAQRPHAPVRAPQRRRAAVRRGADRERRARRARRVPGRLDADAALFAQLCARSRRASSRRATRRARASAWRCSTRRTARPPRAARWCRWPTPEPPAPRPDQRKKTPPAATMISPVT